MFCLLCLEKLLFVNIFFVNMFCVHYLFTIFGGHVLITFLINISFYNVCLQSFVYIVCLKCLSKLFVKKCLFTLFIYMICLHFQINKKMALSLDPNSVEPMDTNEIELEPTLSQNSQEIYAETETSFINNAEDRNSVDQESRSYLQNNVSETIVDLDSRQETTTRVQKARSSRKERNSNHIVPNLYKGKVPKAGTPVTTKDVKRAGPYVLGPLIGTSPVKSILQCLAKKSGTDKFYMIKFLALRNPDEEETQDERQGKTLLHVEYSLLTMLKDMEGVIHHHGFFKVKKIKKIMNNKYLIL